MFPRETGKRAIISGGNFSGRRHDGKKVEEEERGLCFDMGA